MVEPWLGRMRKRFAGARNASDLGRLLARGRHLEMLNQPLPMSAQHLAKLAAEVDDAQGEGTFLLVVDCDETGIEAARFVRRFATLEELQEAKRQVDAPAVRPRGLAQSSALPAGPDGGRLVPGKKRMAATFLAGPRRHPDHDHPSEENHGWIDSAPAAP